MWEAWKSNTKSLKCIERSFEVEVEAVLRSFAKLAKRVGWVVFMHDLEVFDGWNRHTSMKIQSVRTGLVVKHRISSLYNERVGGSVSAELEVLPQRVKKARCCASRAWRNHSHRTARFIQQRERKKAFAGLGPFKPSAWEMLAASSIREGPKLSVTSGIKDHVINP